MVRRAETCSIDKNIEMCWLYYFLCIQKQWIKKI